MIRLCRGLDCGYGPTVIDDDRAARVLTLNVYGVDVDWPARRQRMIDGFRELNADLIVLQETVVRDSYDQVRDVLGAQFAIVHQSARHSSGMGVSTVSRWPVGDVHEFDLHVTARTGDFPCAVLVTEVLAPEPIGRIWLANHFPSWQPAYEVERQQQALIAARELERLVSAKGGHVIVAGDLDADPDSDSIRFWTGRHGADGLSVCYRDAWASVRDHSPGGTFLPSNPYSADWDWPFRRIDYVMVRCGDHGGPTLRIVDCARIFDGPSSTASDHYGVMADLRLPEQSRRRAGDAPEAGR
jgi:endonuclease/exonuclease/phosphatase family metal-dependent hydrolase